MGQSNNLHFITIHANVYIMNTNILDNSPGIYRSSNIGNEDLNRTQLNMPSEMPTTDPDVAERRAKIEAWDNAVTELQPRLDQEPRRVALRPEFTSLLETNGVSGRDLTTSQRREIAAHFLAASVYGGERAYNHSTNWRYHRTQAYYDTIDNGGDVWRTFEEARPEIGITGQPLLPGPYKIHSNPRHQIIAKH